MRDDPGVLISTRLFKSLVRPYKVTSISCDIFQGTLYQNTVTCSRPSLQLRGDGRDKKRNTSITLLDLQHVGRISISIRVLVEPNPIEHASSVGYADCKSIKKKFRTLW